MRGQNWNAKNAGRPDITWLGEEIEVKDMELSPALSASTG